MKNLSSEEQRNQENREKKRIESKNKLLLDCKIESI